MLQSIALQNFQVHSKTAIRFDPSITTIVGSSDVGKSAVIRACRWLAFNNPAGMAFIKDGAKGCMVSLKVDGHTIKRRRSKSVNHYELDGKTLEAFGQGGVPNDISNILQLSELNFQRQHDAPLWMAMSPGDVAKELNKVVDLDLIDRVMIRLGKQVRTASTELSICEGRLLAARATVEQLSWVEDADEEYKGIERLHAKVSALEEQRRKLEVDITAIDTVQWRIAQIEESLEPLENSLREISELRREFTSVLARGRELAKMIKDIEDTDEELATAQKRIDSVESKLSTVTTCPICGRPI